MIEEHALVVAVENDAVWVETSPQSACGSCAVEKGCGQGVVAKFFQGRIGSIRAVAEQNYKIGEHVVIGVPEDVVLKGALLVYLFPLLGMLIVAGVFQYFESSEPLTILSGFVGFGLGLAVVFWHGRAIKNDSRYQPVVLRRVSNGLDYSEYPVNIS